MPSPFSREAGRNSYLEDDLGSSTFYFIVGENMAETRPVNFGLINDCRLKNGAKMVVVDPRQTVTAAKADQWFPIRPGTDMALAMAYHIITKDLVNKEFIAKWVEGYDKVRESILGKKYTPAWAEPITDISASEIKRLAEDYARAERATIFASRGLAQHSNAVQTIRAFMMLAAITGRLKPAIPYIRTCLSHYTSSQFYPMSKDRIWNQIHAFWAAVILLLGFCKKRRQG